MAHKKKARCGVYSIRRKRTDRCYVGSSKDVDGRLVGHRRGLTNGVHRNPKLLAAWKKYGEAAFIFEIIELCSPRVLLKREQYYIERLNSCYNCRPEAASNLGFKWSAEARANMSKAVKGKPRSPAQQAATKRSLELARAKSRANKPGWVPKHRIGMKDSTATIEKRRNATMKTKAGKKFKWITDGVSETQLQLPTRPPKGWAFGRQPKIGLIGKSRVGEKRSQAAKEKMRQAHLGVKLSDTHRLAQSQGQLTRWLDVGGL